MTTYDVLCAAKKVIDTPEKWCKGRWADDEGRYCAVGALMFGIEAEFGEALTLLMQSVPAEFRGQGMPMAFNDAQSTLHADVMALYDRAIEKARGK